MKSKDTSTGLTRRELLQISTAGAALLGAKIAFPELAAAARQSSASAGPQGAEEKLYADTLKTWCDGLIAAQIKGLGNPMLDGGLLCAACGLIHGRCGDAVHPLLRVAHTSGDEKYLRAALAVHEWSERTVSRPDGSWVNDVSLSGWQGITVFHAIALAEALSHHGAVLDATTRQRWTDRLARAVKFLDGFISIETGNVNYPVTASLAFVLCGQLLGEAHYVDRARALVHEVIAQQFTPDGFLVGEGHPLKGVSAKGCRPVDLGYNVEESLPALALYALLTDDKAALDVVVPAFKTHLEFMLPDGAWDNSWGTRNYKWSWWGSRTSDGCQSALVLLGEREPSFREAARRNVELMAACTHDGLLYGGPDYYAHGDPACVHHSFTHAKALATALDRGKFEAASPERAALPRDQAYGLKTFSTIGTRLAAVGDWRATVTEYDWEYVEQVQAGGGGSGGGHVSGGALSLLFHRRLGPVLTASMTEYQMIEIANQQAFRGGPHMDLTPRIESSGAAASAAAYTSLNDLKAVVTAEQQGGEVVFHSSGRLMTASRHPAAGGNVGYHLAYKISAAAVEITAGTEAADAASQMGPPRLIVPVIARADDHVELLDAQTVRITRPTGSLTVRTDAAGFEAIPKERTFNLVPGFEAVPLQVALLAGKEVTVRIEAS